MPNRSVRTIVEGQKVVELPADCTVDVAAKTMKECRIGAVLVVEGGRLAGIFTERDALFRVLAEERDPRTTQLAEVMTLHPQTIGPDQPFGHALHMMYEGGFRHVPVVENGRPVGIVSSRDALGPELGEFVAELGDRERIGEILG